MDQTSTSTWPTRVYEFLSALNIFLSIAATLGNAVIVVALHKESSLYPPTKLLFRCLAVTDLCVGLITQPVFAAFLMSSVTTAVNWRVKHYTAKIYRASSFTLCNVSILVSTAISVDRLLALLLGLRYRHTVTLRRVRAVMICFWLIGVLCALMFFWNSSIAYTVASGLILLCITTSVLSYTKIYLKLRHHQLQVHVPQGQPNGGGILLNIARYKKSVASVLWVQITLVACYVPFMVARFVVPPASGQVPRSNLEILIFLTATLTYLNSSLNPILYCWRIRTVRQAAKDTIKQLNCSKSA